MLAFLDERIASTAAAHYSSAHGEAILIYYGIDMQIMSFHKQFCHNKKN